jgi:SAM-dependent methyltransferase
MQTVHSNQIKVPDRQRKRFDVRKIDELADGIEDKGLMHAIVLRPNGDGYLLVAGERRLRAMQRLHGMSRSFLHDGTAVPVDQIPYVNIAIEDEIRAKEAELEENVLREDLTWQERNDAIAELHRLRTAQNPGQTRGDTAKELAAATDMHPGAAYRSVQRALLIDEYKDDPEVARAKSPTEAFKIVARKLEADFEASIERPRPARGAYACMFGDCREKLPTLKGDWFSAIIADPPYGIGADDFGDAAQSIHHYEDTPAMAIDVAESIFREGYRVLRPTGHLFMFCDLDRFHELAEISRKYQFVPWRTPLVWHKAGAGHAPDPSRGPRRNYELILFCRKGDHKVKQVFSDVITIPPDRERLHAAQKPVDLYKHLLSWGCITGDHVLDPCCGSGTIFPAAKALGLKSLGIEVNPEFYERAAGVARSM